MHIACMKAEDAVEDEAPTTTPSYQAWSSMPSCMPLSFLIYIYIYISKYFLEGGGAADEEVDDDDEEEPIGPLVGCLR